MNPTYQNNNQPKTQMYKFSIMNWIKSNTKLVVGVVVAIVAIIIYKKSQSKLKPKKIK